MAGLKDAPHAVARALRRLVPDSLFGRLALLLMVAVITSHVLALTLLFELRPAPPPELAAAFAKLPSPPRSMHPGLWMDIGVRLGVLLLAAWVAARWLSAPIRQMAAAARELGRDIHRAPLPAQGPRECREATDVFNQMQDRIRLQLAQRDQFVAAVSHDLRTPLTRLALRAQSLEREEDRLHFGRDIVEMDQMIRATLDYLRGAADAEPWVLLDVEALLASLADDCQAMGQDVVWEPPAPRQGCGNLRTQVSALRRCVGNLVDNAVRYGGSARIRCTAMGDDVDIEVCDPGPGIAEDDLQRVLAPFYRIESSRNRHHGGVGLGLSIADDIAQRLQGRLSLKNGAEAGLVATVRLPRVPSTSGAEEHGCDVAPRKHAFR